METSPLTKNQEKQLSALTMAGERQLTGKYLIEGIHLLEEALGTNQNIEMVLFLKDDISENQSTLIGKVQDRNIQIYFINDSQLKKISGLKNPVGPIAVVNMAGEAEWIGSPIIFCDQIQDPGNLGSIIRSAAAAGFAVILSSGCADLYNLKTIRATQGTLYKTPVVKTADSLVFLEQAKREGYSIFALMGDGSEQYSTIKYPVRSVIIVGNEGAGISPDLLKYAKTVKIPLANQVESLNASIAAALVMFEVERNIDARKN